MMQKIINEVVKAYKGYDGLDEIKRGIKLAMAMSGLNWTKEEYNEIFNEVLYKLATEKEV